MLELNLHEQPEAVLVDPQRPYSPVPLFLIFAADERTAAMYSSTVWSRSRHVNATVPWYYRLREKPM